MSEIKFDQEESQNAVLYISRLPYGFDEQAAFEFFKQFGDIKGVCFPRNKKTGRSKGYMFVLFEDRGVAQECAKAIDGYMMFSKSVKCVVLPESHEIIESRFKKQPNKFRFIPWKTIFANKFNTTQNVDKKKKKIRKMFQEDQKKLEKLKEKNLDFPFPTYKDFVLKHNQFIMNNFYDNYENQRKSKFQQKFFEDFDKDEKQEQIQEKRMNCQKEYKIGLIVQRFIESTKNKVQQSHQVHSSLLVNQQRLNDLQITIQRMPQLEKMNFLKIDQVNALIEPILHGFEKVQEILRRDNIEKINSKFHLKIINEFLINYSLMQFILTKNYSQFVNKIGILRTIQENKSSQIVDFFLIFYKFQTLYQSFNYFLQDNLQSIRNTRNQLEEIIFKEIETTSLNLDQKIIFKLFDQQYIKLVSLELQKNQDIIYIRRLLLLNKFNSCLDSDKGISSKIFMIIFSNSETLQKAINTDLFDKDIQKMIEINCNDLHDKNDPRTNTVVQNLIYLVLYQALNFPQKIESILNNIEFSQRLLSLCNQQIEKKYIIIKHNQQPFHHNIIDQILDGRKLLKLEQLQEGLFKNVIKYLMIFVLCQIHKAHLQHMLISKTIVLMKEIEVIQKLENVIISKINKNENLEQFCFEVIILVQIINIRRMVEDELSIWDNSFKRHKEFSFCFYGYFYSLIKNLHSQIYSQQPLVQYIYQQSSILLEYILQVNDKRMYFKFNYLEDSNLIKDYELDFVKDFYFMFDIESRFKLMKKQFGYYKTYKEINQVVHRDFLLEQGTSIFKSLLEDKSLTGREKIRIAFIDETGNYEAGIDQGGLYKDFINLYTQQILDPNYGYFIETDENHDIYINPSSYYWTQEETDIYQIMGLVIARCFFEGFTLNRKLSRTFIRKIKKMPNYFKELQYFDQDLYKQLCIIKDSKDVESLGLTFSVIEKDSQKEIELTNGGSQIEVNQSNVLKYVYLYADYKMNVQVKKQFEAFYEGFSKVFDLKILDLFSEYEVQALINGTEQEIDIEDLRENCKYPHHWLINEFWAFLHTFSNEQKKQLLKFVTNYERPPLFGFKNLQPQFMIHLVDTETDKLPWASTCVNSLYIPYYSSAQIMKEKLIKAISMTKGHYTV